MTATPDMTPSQRSAAIGRIDENLALRSGAGCGKTFVLARRFTELLMASKDENPLRRFVAMTFTDKAALEMSQRVREMLTQFAAAATGADRLKFLGWLEEIDEARISTIHGFCSNLLRTYAVQAGLDPDFGVCADDLAISQMSAQAAEQALLQAVNERHEPSANLLLTMPFDFLAGHVESLVDSRTLWGADAYADPTAILENWRKLADKSRRQAWRELAADAAIAQQVTQLAQTACADPADPLAEFRDAKLAIIAKILGDPSQRTVANFDLLNESPGRLGSDKAWGGKGSSKVVRDRLKELMSAVGEYRMFAENFGEPDRRCAEAISTMTWLATRADELFARQKRKLGLLDFTDLLFHARKLLEKHADIRQTLRKQIGQLLVDECQDTDAFQVAMILMAVFPDECWQDLLRGRAGNVTLPEGKLFFVGDAKQSIYRFRGAQVEVFEDLCRQLGPSKQEGLDLSFRTHQAGVEFVNHVFAPLMGGDYAPIGANRKFVDPDSKRGPSVEIILADAADGSTIDSAAAAVDAQASVAAWRIRQMLDRHERLVWDHDAKDWRGVQPRDIAILFARMTNTLVYERELSRYGIAYYVVAGTGFFRQQEVFDVLNALRVIDNPFDDIAFVGLLRSSMFGLDDNALMHIALGVRPPYLPALRRKLAAGQSVAGLDDSQSLALRTAIELLTHLSARKDAVGIDELIEQFLDATGYPAILLSQFQGRRMLGNVRMLIDQARSATGSGMALADFIRQIGLRVMEEPRYEQSAVAGEGDNVVRLMTIHKAKGLEFPVVMVPDLNAGRRGREGDMLIRADWGLVLNLKSDPDDADANEEPDRPLSYRLARRLEKGDARREDIRKLYVAMTRHEDHLVLLGANHRMKDGGFAADSYLGMIDSVLHIAGAVDAGRTSLSYGKGFAAAVGTVASQPPPQTARQQPAGVAILKDASSAQELAERISLLAPPTGDLPYVGALRATLGRTELAVTALGEFAKCPTLYRWRYELRVPNRVLEEFVAPQDHGPEPAAGAIHALDAATMGTLFHGCMENLDICNPQSADALLIAQAQELGLELPDVAPLATEFEQMLQLLYKQDLWAQLLGGKVVHRELDFVMDFPPAVLRGQIDLLYQDAAGMWHIVDYKSDRLGAQSPQEHAERYRLQVLLYAIASGRCAGVQVADATIYFLRSGQACRFAVTPDAVRGIEQQVHDLAIKLIASRRSGRYERCQARTADSARTSGFAERRYRGN